MKSQGISFQNKSGHPVLVNRLVKLALEKVWSGAQHDHSCRMRRKDPNNTKFKGVQWLSA